MMRENKCKVVEGGGQSQTELRRFNEFTELLSDAHLPGVDDRALLKKVYALAKKRIEKERQSRLATELSKGRLRNQIRIYRKAIRAVGRADSELVLAQEICATGFKVAFYEWNRWFEPVRRGIEALKSNLMQFEETVTAQVHPRYLKRGEKPTYKALFPDYDYDLPRLGWKPSQKWFLEELRRALSDHFRKKQIEPPPNQALLRSLINKIMVAAFNESLSDDAIKTAMYRISKERKLSISKRTKRIPKSRKI